MYGVIWDELLNMELVKVVLRLVIHRCTYICLLHGTKCKMIISCDKQIPIEQDSLRGEVFVRGYSKTHQKQKHCPRIVFS